MRHLFHILISILFLSGGQALFGQKVYEGMVCVKQNIAEVKNDSVYLEMDISIHGLNINSRESLVLYPTLFNDTDSVMLPPVIINGNTKQKKVNRAIKLKGRYPSQTNAYVVIENSPVIHRVIDYEKSLIYAPWMEKAGLKLIGKTTNQDEKTVNTFVDILTDDLKLGN